MRMEFAYTGGGVQVAFDGIPPADVRTALKRARFRWNPRGKVWARRGSTGTADLLTWIGQQIRPV